MNIKKVHIQKPTSLNVTEIATILPNECYYTTYNSIKFILLKW